MPFGDSKRPFGDSDLLFGEDERLFGDSDQPFGEDETLFGSSDLPFWDDAGLNFLRERGWWRGTRRLRGQGRVGISRMTTMTDGTSGFPKRVAVAGKAAAGAGRGVARREEMGWCLGHEVRWRILEELSKGGPLMVVELAGALGVEQNMVSKHIRVLLEAGMVVRGQAGMYLIPAGFLAGEGGAASGERVVDYGAVVLRFGSGNC